MSLGDPRQDKDHNGAPCAVLDIIFSPQAISMAEQSRQDQIVFQLRPEQCRMFAAVMQCLAQIIKPQKAGLQQNRANLMWMLWREYVMLSCKPCELTQCGGVSQAMNTGCLLCMHRPLKTFMVELALAWAGDAHGLKLGRLGQWKLPKMRYKGSVAPQKLRLQRNEPVSCSMQC